MMSARPLRRPVVWVAVCLLAAMAPPAAAHEDLTDYVDPFIGTLGSGFVFPGPAAPFGMVQLSPDTEGYFAYTGYLWSDQFIRSFSHVHVESMGVQTAGDIPFMPTTGPVLSTDPLVFMSRFSHATESASPGYYQVLLETYGIRAELTAGLRVGMHRYTYPPGVRGNLLIYAGRSIPRQADPLRPGLHPASLDVDPATRTVTGTAVTNQGYRVHFATRFSAPFASVAVWDRDGQTPRPGTSASGEGAGAVVSFDAQTVLAKTGISFVSRAGALANLEAELPGEDFDFDALRKRTRAAWEEALHAIEVRGGTLADRRSFYTALYHAMHHPNVFQDADGSYLGNDGRPHPGPGFSYYTNFSLWDTYRGENQLLALVAPERFADMMRSLAQVARDGGRLPRWNLQSVYADFMVGEPEVPAIVDGYCRGLVPSEIQGELYEAMRSLLLDPAHHRDPDFLTLGYVPHDRNDGGASVTLEHAIAAFALALWADAAGLSADRDALVGLAGRWRNVFDAAETRFVRPRLSDGSWMTPYHPEFPDGFVEGNGWQYTWLVPHDAGALLDAMGRPLARQRLDTFFAAPPEVQKHLSLFGIAYYGNQYSPANEHDLQAPYLGDWAGEPWKTQRVVRDLQTLFRPTPDGLPGNDDLGTMSAWYVWSALGFYPAVGGAPIYVMGSPVFEEASVRLPGGRFVVRAPGASVAGRYVQSARLNGAPLQATWFSHDAIRPGGELVVEMGPLPSRWGSDGPPPSLSADGLAAFRCRP